MSVNGQEAFKRPGEHLPAFYKSLRAIARNPGVCTPAGWARWGLWQFRELFHAFPVKLRLSHSWMLAERGCSVGNYVAYCGLYDFDNMNLLMTVIRPGEVFLDVGANVGAYSLLAAECGARVLAFEPDPVAAARWEVNRRMNGYDRMELLPVAVGDRDGTAWLTDKPGAATNRLSDEGRGRPVPVCRLDTIVQQRQIRPAVIKIDVEGHEFAVLRGLGELLAAPDLKYVQMEVNGLSERTEHCFEKSRALLASAGLGCFTYDHLRRALTHLPAGVRLSPTGDVIAVSGPWLLEWQKAGVVVLT